jgi:oligoribonuclease NrnB/cAMP/cGMP phosphodiesterase (DHH superfamily)
MTSRSIFYHKNCSDGFGASWVFWLKFKDNANYEGRDYGREYQYSVSGQEVYFLDYCPKRNLVEDLKKQAAFLVLIDHHLSSQSLLLLFNETVFDVNHSGCVLSWKYLFPTKDIPRLLLYTEDMDLWKFELPYSREVNAVIQSTDFTYENWNQLDKKLANNKLFLEIVEQGKTIIKSQNNLIEEIAENAVLVNFEGYQVLAVNSSILISELGEKLVRKQPPLAIIWYMDNFKIKVSLRSDGSVDVAKIAEKYGGGGHLAASAFSLPLDSSFPWTIINQDKAIK